MKKIKKIIILQIPSSLPIKKNGKYLLCAGKNF